MIRAADVAAAGRVLEQAAMVGLPMPESVVFLGAWRPVFNFEPEAFIAWCERYGLAWYESEKFKGVEARGACAGLRVRLAACRVPPGVVAKTSE